MGRIDGEQTELGRKEKSVRQVEEKVYALNYVSTLD